MSEIDGEKTFERLLASFLRDELAPAGPACPAPGSAAAYYEGKLSEPEARQFEQHLADCGGCQAEVTLLVRLEHSSAEPSETRPSEAVTAAVQMPGPSDTPPEIPEKEAPVETAPAGHERLLVDEITEESFEEEAAREQPARKDIEAAVERKEVLPFKAGQRRSPWRWVAPLALAATAVFAVSLTLRFAPMVEEASRKARESDVVAPPHAPPSTAATRSEVERGSNQGFKDGGAAQDRLWQSEPPAGVEKAPAVLPPSQRSGGLAAAPTQARPEAPAASAPAPPQVAATGKPAERLPPKAAPSPPEEMNKKEDARAKAMIERSAIAAAKAGAPSARAERPRDAGPIVIVARTNLDAAWRLSGNGIERSDDAGKTWRPQMSFTGAALLTGSAPSAETCWVAGQRGVVLRTTDGEHWERLISPTQDDLVQITAWNAASATIKSASGARFSTSDGGQTWSQL